MESLCLEGWPTKGAELVGTIQLCHADSAHLLDDTIKQGQLLNPVHECVEVVNKSVFRWDKKEPSPCFLVMMEVVVSFQKNIVD